MANWKSYRIIDAVNEIDDEKFVLPVIQRSLVWTEEKMELLFDTLLKGDSFGGIMAIEEEKDKEPLFTYRPFTKDGNFIPSKQVGQLEQPQFFVIDGQQRLQSFYIGLKGTINGKSLFFDLFSDFNKEYEFKFEQNEKELPKISKENAERCVQRHLWYPAKDLLRRLRDTNDEDQVADEINRSKKISEENEQKHIQRNVKAFYRNIISAQTLGISTVAINRSLPQTENRQRIVELFKRLNDGGTRLSSFDLVASILKGFDWQMEGFLQETLESFADIGLTQDNLVKLIFLLRDNASKEMASIEASDAEFAIANKSKIRASLTALRRFLELSKTYDYFKNGTRSFIPLFVIAYHLFHKGFDPLRLEHYFDNFETGNEDFPTMRKWLYHSLINGVFKSRGAGWIPYRTGISKIMGVLKTKKKQGFPCEDIFSVYNNHPVAFTTAYTCDNLDRLDSAFVFYLMYDCTTSNRTNDIDHIMPKSILESKGYGGDKINSIKNYQLLDYGTNRGAKNGKPFAEWVNNLSYVKDRASYLAIHLIPNDSALWEESRFDDFSSERANLILGKITKSLTNIA